MVGTLNTAGAEVVLTGRNADRLDQRAASMSGSPLVVPGDLRDAAFRASLIEAVRDHHGYLDVLVNAVGTCDNGPLEEQSHTDVADIIAIDLLAAIDLCRLAAPLLLDRPDASVINIASIFGQISSGGGMAGYHAAKGKLHQLHLPPRGAVEPARCARQRAGAGLLPHATDRRTLRSRAA